MLGLLFMLSCVAYGQNIVGCPVYDPSGRLHLFTSKGDYSLSSNSYELLPTSPIRPSFKTSNLVCMPANLLNSVYFLNADEKTPNLLHSFNFDTKAWRSVTLTGPAPNMANLKAIMDHDTLVIYAFADGQMIRIGDANELNLRFDTNPNQSFSLPWIPASNNPVPFSGANYSPVMAHAWFNIYFFGVPGTSAGQVWGFRIHYGEWGSRPQPVGSDFPVSNGQATTFFFKYPEQNTHNGAPAHVAFIPDDLSGVYVVNSYVNTTTKSVGPPSSGSSPASRYAASGTTLVQFTPSTGLVRTLDFTWLANKQPDPKNKWIDLPAPYSATSVGSNGEVTGSGSGSDKKSQSRNDYTLLESLILFLVGAAFSII
ncbi:hypothetical protein BC833DRAFT_582638 [Globomyces pollinis-pini]|nr:hypothetical protein BC833DRAFT_582638 [Globomyces pollinis-pini]